MAETLRRRSPSEQAAWQEGYQYGLKMGARSEPPVPGETWAETQARRQRNLASRPESPSPQALLARWPEADLFAALDAEGWFRGMETGEASRATSKVYARLARSERPSADAGPEAAR